MKKHINILFAIIGMLALAGCENPLSGAKNQVSGAQGAVTVTFETPQAAKGARTIYPDLNGFTRYELTFSGGPVVHTPEALTEGNAIVMLPEGNWTITATAYSGKGTNEIASAQGSTTVEISSGVTTSASITLGPLSSGSGTFIHSVTVPSGATGILMVRTPTGDDATYSVVLKAGTNEDTRSCPPGEYHLFVSLTKDEKHAGRTEALHIYAGLTSEARYTFTEDDFIGVETLAPAYDAFSNAEGTSALPSNADAISLAQGSNTAVFAIVGGGMDVATIDPSTGELTLVDTGEITVSLVITTASGVVTHIGTSERITVTKLDPRDFTAPGPKTANGVTATVSFDRATPQVAGTVVTARVTLSGMVGKTGRFTVDLTSDKASLMSNPKDSWLNVGAEATDTRTFPFTMPDVSVDDFVLTLSFVEIPPLSSTIIGNPSDLADYITTNCAGGTAANPKVILFTGGIGKSHLITVRNAVVTANTYVIWNLSEITGTLSAGDIGQAITYAFPDGLDTSRIKGLVLPAGLTTIERNAFNGPGTYLTSITLPSSITSIEYGAFYRCSGLTSIDLPANLTSIGYSAFEGCSGLTSIDLPANLTSIEYSAFSGCSGLTSIDLPASLTSIGVGAFSSCSGTFTTNGGIYTTACGGKILIRDGTTVVSGLREAGHVDLSSEMGFTSIDERAFSGCSGLTSIDLPASLTSIGDAAFAGCSDLTSIDLPGLTSIGDYAFTGCRSLTSVSLPAGLTSIPYQAFSNCSGLTSIDLPVDLTSIGDRAFYGCSSLTSIDLPASLLSIGDQAFSGCSKLNSVTVRRDIMPLTTLEDYSLFQNALQMIYVPLRQLEAYKKQWDDYYYVLDKIHAIPE
jgi:hypothetical protein